jgi:hypothetical protein
MGKGRDRSLYPIGVGVEATREEKQATREYVEKRFPLGEARTEILQALGLESYTRKQWKRVS